ncbi:hypothetical protein ON010_g2578 [Phytophthora cinnamomi]|nr:hypothetical protein ON010_g2578 [Phytophthora cinnamomi]
MFGASHANSAPFIVYENIASGKLTLYLARSEDNERRYAWGKLHQAAIGLDYIYKKGIVHDDLKLSNRLAHQAKAVRLIMSPSQASNGDFPRLIDAENSVTWKTPYATIDGKHLLGYMMKHDCDGISEKLEDESESDMFNTDGSPTVQPLESVDLGSDAMDYK